MLFFSVAIPDGETRVASSATSQTAEASEDCSSVKNLSSSLTTVIQMKSGSAVEKADLLWSKKARDELSKVLDFALRK